MNKKNLGDAWEQLCCRILELEGVHCRRLCDEEDPQRFGLIRKDMGIDLIGTTQTGDLVAVQCKFRSQAKRISWRDVATFYALCDRTGPWSQRVVMTTATSLNSPGGHANVSDRFIGASYFKKMPREAWLDIGKLGKGQVCGGLEKDMHAARLQRFGSAFSNHASQR